MISSCKREGKQNKNEQKCIKPFFMFIYVKQINKMNHFLKCPQNFSSFCFFFTMSHYRLCVLLKICFLSIFAFKSVVHSQTSSYRFKHVQVLISSRLTKVINDFMTVRANLCESGRKPTLVKFKMLKWLKIGNE